MNTDIKLTYVQTDTNKGITLRTRHLHNDTRSHKLEHQHTVRHRQHGKTLSHAHTLHDTLTLTRTLTRTLFLVKQFFTKNHEGVEKFVLQVFPPGTEGFLRVALLQSSLQNLLQSRRHLRGNRNNTLFRLLLLFRFDFGLRLFGTTGSLRWWAASLLDNF